MTIDHVIIDCLMRWGRTIARGPVALELTSDEANRMTYRLVKLSDNSPVWTNTLTAKGETLCP